MALKITKLAKDIFITDDDIHFGISTTKDITPESIDAYRKEDQSREDAYICLLKDILKILANNKIHRYAYSTAANKETILLSLISGRYNINKDDEIEFGVNVIN